MYFVKKSNEDKKNNLVDEFQNFFMDSFFSNKALKTDIVENEDNYILSVELPGVEKESISLDFNNQYLTLAVNQTEDKGENEKHYIRKERTRFSYSRSYYLDKADENSITAKLENGVLTINVGKEKKEIKKTISIN